MDALAAAKGSAPPLSMPSRFATSLSTQRKWLMRKFFGIYWCAARAACALRARYVGVGVWVVWVGLEMCIWCIGFV